MSACDPQHLRGQKVESSKGRIVSRYHKLWSIDFLFQAPVFLPSQRSPTSQCEGKSLRATKVSAVRA